MLIDTHAHLYWETYTADLDEVIQRSLDTGVTTIINVGVDVELSKKALRQAQDFDGELSRTSKLSDIPGFSAYSTIGIHPHEALKYFGQTTHDRRTFVQNDIDKLEEIYNSNPKKVAAVGECGLDYYLDRNDIHPDITLPHYQVKNLQRQLFQAQIDLAKKLNLPLIVHCRDDRSKDPNNTEAWDEVLSMISNYPAILHCYSGLLPTTNYILHTTNLLVSFAGTLTYPKNDYLREAAKLLPLEKIILETDCPFLPPQSKRGQRNEPANILEIAQLIAELKNISVEQVASQTTKNVKKVFPIN